MLQPRQKVSQFGYEKKLSISEVTFVYSVVISAMCRKNTYQKSNIVLWIRSCGVNIELKGLNSCLISSFGVIIIIGLSIFVSVLFM